MDHPHTVAPDQPSTVNDNTNDPILIAVVGLTGAGKTSFINLASNSSLRVGHDLDSCTTEIQHSEPFMLNGKQTILLDTPGFDDTTKTEVEILQLIAEFLAGIYVGGKKLNGIIFLHRISDVRMGGVATKNFRIFRLLCGDAALQNVIITTNRWSNVDQDTGERRQNQLAAGDQFFKLALDKGARLMAHTDTIESAHTIISQLSDCPPVALRIQQELVDEHKGLSETEAGKELNKELEEEARKHEEEMNALQREMQGTKDNQEEDLKEIQEEHEKARKAMEKARKEKEKLKRGQNMQIEDMKNMMKSMAKKQESMQNHLVYEEERRRKAEERATQSRLSLGFDGAMAFLSVLAIPVKMIMEHTLGRSETSLQHYPGEPSSLTQSPLRSSYDNPPPPRPTYDTNNPRGSSRGGTATYGSGAEPRNPYNRYQHGPYPPQGRR